TGYHPFKLRRLILEVFFCISSRGKIYLQIYHYCYCLKMDVRINLKAVKFKVKSRLTLDFITFTYKLKTLYYLSSFQSYVLHIDIQYKKSRPYISLSSKNHSNFRS